MNHISTTTSFNPEAANSNDSRSDEASDQFSRTINKKRYQGDKGLSKTSSQSNGASGDQAVKSRQDGGRQDGGQRDGGRQDGDSGSKADGNAPNNATNNAVSGRNSGGNGDNGSSGGNSGGGSQSRQQDSGGQGHNGSGHGGSGTNDGSLGRQNGQTSNGQTNGKAPDNGAKNEQTLNGKASNGSSADSGNKGSSGDRKAARQALTSVLEDIGQWVDGARAGAVRGQMKDMFGGKSGGRKVLQDLVSGKGLPKVKVVDDATLKGAGGAYSNKDGGTIYVARSTVEKGGDNLKRVIAEELGHHVDHKLGGKDARGDEGALFALSLYGASSNSKAGADGSGERTAKQASDEATVQEQLVREQQELERTQNDKGSITVDGKKIEVEFSGTGKQNRALASLNDALPGKGNRAARSSFNMNNLRDAGVQNVRSDLLSKYKQTAANHFRGQVEFGYAVRKDQIQNVIDHINQVEDLTSDVENWNAMEGVSGAKDSLHSQYVSMLNSREQPENKGQFAQTLKLDASVLQSIVTATNNSNPEENTSAEAGYSADYCLTSAPNGQVIVIA